MRETITITMYNNLYFDLYLNTAYAAHYVYCMYYVYMHMYIHTVHFVLIYSPKNVKQKIKRSFPNLSVLPFLLITILIFLILISCFLQSVGGL